ncbi:MAG TPA: hypothetical protein VGL04_00615 [Sporichthyaceae bacterium]
MSGSGLVYAAVLAAWGAYFVSRSMRSGAREVAFAPEGTVLRRRGAGDASPGSYSVLRMQADRPALPQVKPRQIAGSPDPAPAPYRVSRATAMRRRRALAVLAGGLLGSVALSPTGVLPGWAPLVPALALVTYLVELRVQTRRAMTPAGSVAVAGEVVDRRRSQREKTGPEFWDPWPSFDPADATNDAGADLATGWEPRPVPLPTYVTAAKAEAAPGTRRIDIAAGRAWIGVAGDDVDADADTRPMPFRPGDVVAETPAAEETATQEEFELKPAVGD